MSEKQFIIPGMCFLIPLRELRTTPDVIFHNVVGVTDRLGAIDRVKHAIGAVSPSIENSEIKKPWYMHPAQEDNLLVLHNRRTVELYTVEHGKVETFEATPDYLKHGDEMIHTGPCIFGWPINVFHRIHSPEGSMSLNFAHHFEDFDIKTNFNIYELNEDTGNYNVIREGHEDQPN